MTRIGSLFSGAGGLDMAVETVFNAKTVWHSEINPAASKVLKHHWPHVPNLGDITTIDWNNVEPVEILCGGFPCQDVSAAGRRAGIKEGTRSGLWSHMADAINVLRPQYVIIENVRGLLSAYADRPVESDADDLGNGPDRPVLRAIGAVFGDLADIGTYEARWVTVAASDIGAPHRRERVFIVATANDDQRKHPIPEPRNPIDIANDYHIKLLPTITTQDGSNNGGPAQNRRNTPPLNSVVTVLPTPSLSDVKTLRRGEQLTETIETNVHTINLADAIEYQHGRDAIKREWGEYAPAIKRWEQITRPSPPPTEPNKNGNPRLSAEFAAWMMGWPEGWLTEVAGTSRNDQLKMCGNGVVPQQAEHALKYLINTHQYATAGGF